MTTVFLMYALVGAVGGVLAGLFGIGGGLVFVPMLVLALNLQGVPNELVMHIALGTSLAIIVFTAVSSARAHHKRGGVDWPVVRRIVLGIVVGTYLGSYVAAWLPTSVLKVIFVCFLYYVSIQMFLNKKPKPSRTLPGMPGMTLAGGIIGLVSSLVGIGGGTLSVPFLVWHNLDLRRAIGTASAIGFPIAVSGTLGYMVNGWNAANLPPGSLGFVYLPGLAGIVVLSVLTAPLGARLAHSLPVPRLKKFFAVLLLVVGTRMLWGLL